VHTDWEFTPDSLAGLYCNFNIDCLGKNGAFIGAKAVPFHKKYEVIDKELSHYMTLISILKLSFEKKSQDDHFYIIADEPVETNSKEHRTWESLRNSPLVKMIFTDEVEIVALKIEEKEATTFL
jgi:hypothetical protein